MSMNVNNSGRKPVAAPKTETPATTAPAKNTVRAENTVDTAKAPASKDGFQTASAVVAKANRPAPTLPVASRPAPSQLGNNFYGQRGELSPNQTGKINGAAELAQFVFAGYNGGEHGPVSITPATLRQGNTSRQVHLVGISGTEAVENQSTGWITNLKSGFQQDNPGLRNARQAILNTVPAGADLVLAGHSQGGMIAQQLAADPTIKARYNVINTVAFGSPLISAGQREGEVHRIAAAGDPVPRASLQSVLLSDWARMGQQDIPTDFPISLRKPGNGIEAHMKDYVSENNTELAKMDAVGRVSPRVPVSIEFNPANRVFFTSPTNTAAP
ncbi:MAG TPA: hypothetical protein VFZ09_13460 [Archangium sp.]|uniref:hypothetical protein n=1 Tax=Archangium sp. TaxID=1872627 RepID=UPI002E372CF4|nr:hypothetical protein [Archangium sp.]HEX5747244.1 hypothetical protein [Archangium sp.]